MTKNSEIPYRISYWTRQDIWLPQITRRKRGEHHKLKWCKLQPSSWNPKMVSFLTLNLFALGMQIYGPTICVSFVPQRLSPSAEIESDFIRYFTRATKIVSNYWHILLVGLDRSYVEPNLKIYDWIFTRRPELDSGILPNCFIAFF